MERNDASGLLTAVPDADSTTTGEAWLASWEGWIAEAAEQAGEADIRGLLGDATRRFLEQVEKMIAASRVGEAAADRLMDEIEALWKRAGGSKQDSATGRDTEQQ